jgi:predicted GNAT family N-acyltransferase
MTLDVVVADASQLDRCHALRQTVFVQEQGVPADIERDALDANAVHFLGTDRDTGRAVATARMVDAGGVAKVGRVAVAADCRNQGLGSQVMRAVLAEARLRGFPAVVLSAQIDAVRFYERLGFAAEGEPFDEAGIRHVRMRHTF